MKRCPACRALHPNDASYCPSDGTPLPGVSSPPPPVGKWTDLVDEEMTTIRAADEAVPRPSNAAALEEVLAKEEVEEIYILGPDRVLITLADGRQERVQVNLGDEAELVALAKYLLGPSGKALGPHAPFADGTVMERYRVHVSLAPSAEPSPQIVIRHHRRIFQANEDRLFKLIQLGTLTSRAALLMRYAMRAEVSVLVVGSTAAGKTTFLCALGAELPRLTPVICVEEGRELDLPGENVSHLLTSPPTMDAPRVTQRFLVQQALRKRPSWIILGEARGEEAWDFAQAGNTGHAIMGSVHANSCRDALERYRDLSMTAGPNMEERVVLASVLRAFRLVIHLQQDRRGGARTVRRIVDVTGNLAEGHIPVLQDLFVREGGSLRCTKSRPYPRLKLLLDRAGLDYEDVIHARGIPDAWRLASRAQQ